MGTKDSPREIGTPKLYGKWNTPVIFLVISMGRINKTVLCKPDTTMRDNAYGVVVTGVLLLAVVVPVKTRPMAQAKP